MELKIKKLERAVLFLLVGFVLVGSVAAYQTTTINELRFAPPGGQFDFRMFRTESGGSVQIVLEHDGTEVGRFTADGITIDALTTGGSLLFSPDNAADVGASGATRPRTIYAGTSVDIGDNAAAGGNLRMANGAGIRARNAANNGDIEILGTTAANLIEIDGGSNGIRITGGDILIGSDTRMTREAAGKVGFGVSATTASLNVATVNCVLTGMTGASVTASNCIPAGSFVLGVTVYVDTAITGATAFTIGDGTDVDRWGTGIALAAATTTSIADFTANGFGQFTSANNVVLTATTSNFTAGAVTVTVYYFDLTAGT